MNHDNLDFLTHIEDEIALEGLDGITLEALWIRLQLRPHFVDLCPLDDENKSFLWSMIVQDNEIFFYKLPSPRESLRIFNRYELLDTEVGIILESNEEFPDIYPFCPLQDEINGIRGSCHTYFIRNDVTDEIYLLSLEESIKKYGNNLVLVASQHLRDKSLRINQTVDKLYDLSFKEYALLERIGRARSMGEITQGKNSLATVQIDPKTLFYLRKRLLKVNLITKQTHRQRSVRGHMCSSSLLHLTRFYIERKSKFHIMIERSIEILRENPNLLCTVQDMKNKIGFSQITNKKLLKNNEFLRFIKTVLVPYRQIYPDADESEWKFKVKDEERTIRCFTLVDSSTKPQDVCAVEDNSGSEDEDEDEQYCGILDQSNIIYGHSLLRQAYQMIEAAGPGGLSQLGLARKLGQTKLDSRCICRNLLRRSVVHTVMNDQGKQRLAFYISNKFAQTGYLTKEFEKERLKILSMIKQTDQPADQNLDESLLQMPSTSRGNELASLEEFEKGVIGTNYSSGSSQAQKRDPLSSTAYQMVLEQDLTDGDLSLVSDLDSSKNNWMLESSPIRKCQLTTKLIKRAYLIIQAVKTEKVIDDIAKLWRMIREAEAKEGLDVVMDRKSLTRLLDRLTKSGYIRKLLVRLKSANRTKSIKIVVDPSLDLEHPLIKTTIEQNKRKFLSAEQSLPSESKSPIKTSVPSIKCESKDDVNELLNDESVGASMKELRKMHSLPIKNENSSTEDNRPRFSQATFLKSSIGPKFVRLQEIHVLLYYMVYGYIGDTNLDQEEAWNSILAEHGNSCLASESRKDYPQIYSAKTSWMMFIPPLPVHIRYQSPGWAFVVDILLRLPLCKFVCIIKVQSTEVLEQLLNHPLKKNLLIKDLAPDLRRHLLQGRRYVSCIMELVNRLCYMGLTQYGDQVMKERDQVFLYLNRNAILVDTTVSGPGYHQITTDKEYIRKQYSFFHMHDIMQYWYDLWTICMHTPLGGHACVEGKKITIQILQKKPQIIESTVAKSVTDASERDFGYIPGDGRGAGGLDSAMFSHLKRNWSFNSRSSRPLDPSTEGRSEDSKGNFLSPFTENNSYVHYLKNMSTFNSVEVRPTKRLGGLKSARLSIYKPKTEEKSAASKISNRGTKRKLESDTSENSQMKEKDTLASKSKKCSFQREIKARKKALPKKPYYDEQDKAALRRMNKLRVDWSSAEDSFLILCKVASSFLYPNRRCQMVGFPVVRDLLHQRFPESRNKTSRACQRRINYILKNSTMEDNVAIFLEEVKQDRSLCQKYAGKKLVLKHCDIDESHKELFKNLIESLINKFGSSGSRSCPDLPDTLEEFESKYQLIRAASSLKVGPKINEISTISEIDYYVVYALIYSSLCTKQDRESWAYQLYLAYQKYPQSLLNSVLTALRESQMISYKKNFNRSKYTRTCLPLSSSPFQLSFTFIYLFNQKYQYEIFGECWNLTKKLLGAKKLQLFGPQSSIEVVASSNIGSDENSSDLRPSNSGQSKDEPALELIKEDDPHDSSVQEECPAVTKNTRKRRKRGCKGRKTKKKKVLQEPSSLEPNTPVQDSTELATDKLEISELNQVDPDSTFKESNPGSCQTNSQDGNFPIVIDNEGGYCATIVALMTTRRVAFDITIPEQIITVDESVADGNTLGGSLMQRVKDHEMQSGRTFKVPDGLQSRSQSDSFAYDEDIYSDEQQVESEAKRRSESEEKPARSANITDASDKCVSIDTNVAEHTDFSVTSQKPSVDLNEQPSSSKIQSLNLSNSRMALYLLREQLSGDISTRKGCGTPDNLIVTACDISCRLRIPSGVPSNFTTAPTELSDVYLPLTEDKIKRALDRRKGVTWVAPLPLETFIETLSPMHPSEYLDLLRRVHSYVEETKEIGASAKMIKTKFRAYSCNPMKALQDLEEANLVWKMGVATLRWVSAYYCKPWMIHTNKIPRAMAKSMEATRIQGVYKVGTDVDDLKQEDSQSSIESQEGDSIGDSVAESLIQPPTKRSDLRLSRRKSTEDQTKPVKPHNLRLTLSLTNRKFRKDLEVSYQKEEAALKMGQSSEYQEIDVAVRPWVRPNGCLNRRVMDRFLGSILLFIMENPGIVAERIAQKFWPALQPAHTYELVETLVDLKCVERFRLKKSHPVTLFSKPQAISIENAEDFDFDEEYIHEAAIDAVLKLAMFIGDKRYKQDFLSTCR